MPLVSYQTGDFLPKAFNTRLSELFMELDRKVSLAMDNKSLLLQVTRPQELTSYLGKRFFFGGGSPRWMDWWALPGDFGTIRPYTHTPFQSAVDGAAIVDADHNLKIVTIAELDKSGLGNPPGAFLDQSLQAHRKLTSPRWPMFSLEPELYWVQESGTTHAEKVHRYAQAELIYENSAASVSLPATYDKYNFFRVHNLNAAELVVSFPGHTLTVPERESKCLRRDSVSSGYLEGGRYFHQFKSGDPRFYKTSNRTDPDTLMIPGPVDSLGSNNVSNPSLLFGFIDMFTRGGYFLEGIKLLRDLTQAHDVYQLYTAYFGNPSVNSTLLADLLHHRGEVIDVRNNPDGTVTETPFVFNGYQTAVTDFLARDIAVTENADGTVQLQSNEAGIDHDLVATGTNLLRQGSAIKPIAALQTGFTLDNHLPPDQVRPVIRSESIETPSWSEPVVDAHGNVNIGASASANLTTHTLAHFSGFTARAFHPLSDTLTALKAFDLFGSPAHTGTQQDTPWATFTGKTVVLTAFGPVFNFTQTVPFNLPFVFGELDEGPPPVLEGWTSALSYHLTGTELQLVRSIPFTNYGWPTSDAPAFISPRKQRVYADTIDIGSGQYRHPDFVGDQNKGNGQDWDIPRITNRSIEPLRVLMNPQYAVLDGSGIHTFLGIHNPDVLREFLDDRADYQTHREEWLENTVSNPKARMLRHPLHIEHFNAMAFYVNSLTKAVPFNLSHWLWRAADHSIVRLTPNSIGLYQTTIRPKNHFATVLDEYMVQLCTDLGLPIKHLADLPSEYDALKTTAMLSANATPRWRTTIQGGGAEIKTDYLGADTAFQTFPEYNLWEGTSVPARIHLFGSQAAAEQTEFDWITIEDVMTVAAAEGVKFHLERLVEPLALQVIASGGISPLPTFRSTGVQSYSGPRPDGNVQDHELLTGFQANYAWFKESATPEEIEWIRDSSNFKVADYRPGDVFTVDVVIPHFSLPPIALEHLPFSLPFPDEYLRQGTGGSISAAVKDATGSLCVQYYSTAAATPGSKAILIPDILKAHVTQTYSEASYGHARLRYLFGAIGVLPVSEGASPEAEVPESLEVAAGETLILAREDKAHRVLFFRAAPVSLD